MRGALVVVLLLAAALPAQAGQVLDRVRQDSVLHCGAEPRPGVAEATEDGGISGVAVDLCRSVAAAVLGPEGRVAFRLYGSSREYDAVRDGSDELAFISDAAIADARLAQHIVTGPVVFTDQLTVLVPDASAMHGLADLGGRTICLMIGSTAQQALEDTVSRLHLTVARLAFEEDVEMLDAYNVQRCDAMVGEVSALEDMRREGGINHLVSRILASPLAPVPVFAVTGINDAQWSALVRRELGK
jgi:general L-amino acid transport system substrate-binding protein